MADISLYNYHEQLKSLIKEEGLDDVITHCRHILQQVPRHIPTYRLLGKALLEQEDFIGAMDIFQRVLSADPEDFIAHVGLAVIYREEGLLKESRWYLERAFEMDPYNNVIQAELKDLYAARGIETERLMLNREALARLHVKGGLYQQAVAELRQSVAENPDRVDLKTLLAEALWRDEQRIDGVEVAQEVLAVLPNCIKANAIIAEVWLVTGRVAEAQEYLQKIHPMLLLDKQHPGEANSPAAIAFRTKGAMPLPDLVTVELLEEEMLLRAELQASAALVDELEDRETFSEDELSTPPDWLTALQEATDEAEASAVLAAEAAPEWSAAEGGDRLDRENGAPEADSPQVPDWLQETDQVEKDDVDSSAGVAKDAEEIDYTGFPSWLAAAALAGTIRDDEDSTSEEEEEGRIDEDSERETSPMNEQEGTERGPQDADMTGAEEEREDLSAPPEDLDDALAWLEGLAARQGARPEELPSLNEITEEDEVDSPYPDWLTGDLDDVPADFLASTDSQEDQPPGDIPDWLLESVWDDVPVETGEPEAAAADVPAADVPAADLSWLDEIAAGGGAALEEPLTLSWEEEHGAAQPADEPAAVESFDAGLSEASLVTGESGGDEPPEDLDAAMAWLEQLAARQGADLDELPTVDEVPQDEPQPAVSDEEEAYPDWLAGLEIDEEEQAGSPILAAGAVALGAAVLGDEDAGQEEVEPEVVPAGMAAETDFAAEFPDDPEDALAWLEELARQDDVPEAEMPVVEEPPTPARPHDVVAAQAAAAAALAIGATQGEEEERTSEAVDDQIPAGELAPAGYLMVPDELELDDEEWVDQIPDDPDAAMAWLEQLAARQGAPLEELPTIDEMSEELAPEAEPIRFDVEEPETVEADDEDWLVGMEDEVAEAMPEWLSMELADLPADMPEEDLAEWVDSGVDVSDWLTAEAEVGVSQTDLDVTAHIAGESEPSLTESAEKEPESPSPGIILPLLQKAREALSQGDTNQALDTYSSFLSQGENLDSLIQELNSTVVEKPHQPKVNRLLGDAYVQKGDLQKALEVYQEALDML